MQKPGEMEALLRLICFFEALMRPNPYSSPIIDMCGKWGFGTLFPKFV